MNIQIVLLLFGGILLLIAILGGGFEIRELKIPKVERIPRALAAVGGIFFIFFGIGIDGDFKGGKETAVRIEHANPESNARNTAMVSFTIVDNLGEDRSVRKFSSL